MVQIIYTFSIGYFTIIYATSVASCLQMAYFVSAYLLIFLASYHIR